MSNLPLRPLVVHFPIVLSVLLPIAAVAALWVLRSRSLRPIAIWSVPLALSLALAVSAWVATQTGEAEEDRVEQVVGDRPMHEHEEAAEQFLVFAAVVALIAIAGLAPGRAGAAARLVTTAASLVVLAMAFKVGEAGGELVYRHNAGAAYQEGMTGVRVDAD